MRRCRGRGAAVAGSLIPGDRRTTAAAERRTHHQRAGSRHRPPRKGREPNQPTESGTAGGSGRIVRARQARVKGAVVIFRKAGRGSGGKLTLPAWGAARFLALAPALAFSLLFRRRRSARARSRRGWIAAICRGPAKAGAAPPPSWANVPGWRATEPMKAACPRRLVDQGRRASIERVARYGGRHSRCRALARDLLRPPRGHSVAKPTAVRSALAMGEVVQWRARTAFFYGAEKKRCFGRRAKSAILEARTAGPRNVSSSQFPCR
jgi:hypothetical protein